MIAEKFYVQVIFNNEKLSELPAVRPSIQMLERYQEFLDTKQDTLIKLNKNQFTNSKEKVSNKIFLPKQTFESDDLIKKKVDKRQAPKEQQDDYFEEISDDFEEIDLKDLEGLDLEVDDDFLDDDMEGANISVSSGGRDNKKLTKRQLNVESLEYHQLPDKKGKNKKKIIMTEDEIVKRNLKEIERKQKLLNQQEEFKQQTVHKILNEVGKKQKQRQEQEQKQSQRKTHNYRQLPANDLIIKYISDSTGERVILSPYLNTLDVYALPTSQPYVPQKMKCSNCEKISKYKIPKSDKHACSLSCFKELKA